MEGRHWKQRLRFLPRSPVASIPSSTNPLTTARMRRRTRQREREIDSRGGACSALAFLLLVNSNLSESVFFILLSPDRRLRSARSHKTERRSLASLVLSSLSFSTHSLSFSLCAPLSLCSRVLSKAAAGPCVNRRSRFERERRAREYKLERIFAPSRPLMADDSAELANGAGGSAAAAANGTGGPQQPQNPSQGLTLDSVQRAR